MLFSAGLLLGRGLLAAVFALAGITKLVDRTGSVKSFIDFGVPPTMARSFAWLLPMAELTCAGALVPGSAAKWGGAGALVLLTMFILGIAFNLARGRRPDCHCFGQLHSAPVGSTTLVRNGLLAGVAALVVWGAPQETSAIRIVQSLGRVEAALLGLAVSVAALTLAAFFVLLQLLRQNGRLLLRLDAIEAKLGLSHDIAQGLPVGSVAPSFTLPDREGRSVSLDSLGQGGRPALLVFIEPECGACDELLPELAEWQRRHSDRLSVVPISRVGADVNRAKRSGNEVRGVLVQKNREVAKVYQVTGTPAAVLIEKGKIASARVAGVDAIRDLVTNTVATRVRQGEAAPALRLAVLDGKTIDISTLSGRRTLLLFWDPGCGYCQKMLDDVRQWERQRPNGAPALVVIAAGSPESNRQQGFTSPVLLDNNFSAGHAFGVHGTPSAVLLDEKGRVASDVGVGAEAVMALAGGTFN